MFFLYSVRSPHRTAKPSRGCLPLEHPRALPAVFLSDRRSPSAMCEFPFEWWGCGCGPGGFAWPIHRDGQFPVAPRLSPCGKNTANTSQNPCAVSAGSLFLCFCAPHHSEENCLWCHRATTVPWCRVAPGVSRCAPTPRHTRLMRRTTATLELDSAIAHRRGRQTMGPSREMRRNQQCAVAGV